MAVVPAACAQSNYAVVRGSILDPQNLAVVGARVHLTEPDTGAERVVTSNSTGIYEIAGLQPGEYNLVVESTGFREAEQSINLEVGQQATIDVQGGLVEMVSEVAVAV